MPPTIPFLVQDPISDTSLPLVAMSPGAPLGGGGPQMCLMTLTGLRRPGQVFGGMSHNVGLSDVFLLVRLGFGIF